MIIKKLFSFCIIFTMVFIYPLTAGAESTSCNNPKDEAEKNYCLMKDRELANKGTGWDKLGTDSLETITILLASLSSMTLVTNKSAEANAKTHVIYFANRLTPYLILGGSVLLIFAEVESYISFKKDCSDLLSSGGTALADMIKKIADKDKGGADPTLTTTCIGDNLKKESQVVDMCRAKACTVRMKQAAAKKVKHLGWAKMAYTAAASMELYNMVVNMWKGGVSTALATTYTTTATTFNTAGTAAAASVYGAAGAPALFAQGAYWAGQAANENRKASDCYNYPDGTDAVVVQTAPMKSDMYYVQNNPIENVVNDQLVLQLMYENHRKALISQIGTSSSFMETAFLIDDYENLIKGRTHSLSVNEFEKVKAADISYRENYQGMNKLLQMSYQLSSNLGIQSAHAKYDMNEILTTLGVAAGVSLALIGATKTVVANMIKSMWKIPVTRVAYIGALAALVWGNQKLYEKNIVKTLDERATSFDDKIAALAPTPSVPEVPEVPTPPSIDIPTPPAIPTPKIPKVANAPQSCIGSDLSEDKTCECLKTNKCNEMKIPDITSPKGMNIPSSVTSAMKNLSNAVNSRSTGNFDKANLHGDSLNAGFAALNNDYLKLRKKIDEERKKVGRAPLDIDKQSQKIQNDLLKAVATAMGMAAPSGNVTAPTLGSSGNGDTSKKDDGKTAPSQTINSSNAGAGGGAAGAATTTAKTDDLGLGLEELGADGLGKIEEEGKVAGLDAYEIKTEDISNRSDENLFKNISSRYLKTAYPILLKELKTEPAAADK